MEYGTSLSIFMEMKKKNYRRSTVLSKLQKRHETNSTEESELQLEREASAAKTKMALTSENGGRKEWRHLGGGRPSTSLVTHPRLHSRATNLIDNQSLAKTNQQTKKQTKTTTITSKQQTQSKQTTQSAVDRGISTHRLNSSRKLSKSLADHTVHWTVFNTGRHKKLIELAEYTTMEQRDATTDAEQKLVSCSGPGFVSGLRSGLPPPHRAM